MKKVPRARFSLLLLPVLALVLAGQMGGSAHAAGPRYYIVVRDVDGPDNMAKLDPIVVLARQIFTEELGKRKEVTLDGAGLPAASPALAEALKKRGLKGYEVTLRLLSIRRSLSPPPKGKQFRVLERGIKLTMVGTTLPGDMLALGGDGESTIQADVGAKITDKQEQDLLSDALRDAISQAVTQALRKLDKGGMVPPSEHRRKR